MKKRFFGLIMVVTMLLSVSGADVWAYEYDYREKETETVEEAVTENAAETVEKAVTENATETVEEAVTENATEIVEEAVTENAAETVEEAVTENATELQDGNETDELLKEAMPVVTYQAHVAKTGWQNAVTSGVAGTVGSGKAMEAIRITVSGVENLGISYRVHGQTYGWQNAKNDGEVAGTTGMSKRIEGISIELTGAKASLYDIYYRVHCQSFGWLDWAKNGQIAGSVGFAKRMEAIEIIIVEKDSQAPGITDSPNCLEQNVTYRGYCQTFGWQNPVSNGKTAGTTGMSKRLEAFEASVLDNDNLGITYSAHVQSVGWQTAVSNGEMAGTIEQALRLEAVKINLTGIDAGKYNVWYRLHVQGYGWLGWAKNGEVAGSVGQRRRVEAIEIRIIPIKASAPGSTTNALLSNSVASQKARAKLDTVGWNLRAAFDYSAGMKYYRNVPVPAGSHLEGYADYGFTNNCGNCYVMAATFCQMAREMGYEAYLVEGYVPRRSGGWAPHGWCEIKVDNKWYVCDPNLTNELGLNGFMVWYGASGTWQYHDYQRVD